MSYLNSSQELAFIDAYTVYTESELLYQYATMLDECYDTLYIGQISFAPSRVLREMDSVAYLCGFIDFTDQYTELTNEYYALTSEVEEFINSLDGEEDEI